MDKREKYILTKQAQAIEDGVICHCKQVSERKIRKAVNNGKRTFIQVKRETGASSSCGLCQPFVEDIIRDALKK
jgi:bacterioferritin-associated ferredoxin